MDRKSEKRAYVAPKVTVVALRVEERLMACLLCPGNNQRSTKCKTGTRTS